MQKGSFVRQKGSFFSAGKHKTSKNVQNTKIKKSERGFFFALSGAVPQKKTIRNFRPCPGAGHTLPTSGGSGPDSPRGGRDPSPYHLPQSVNADGLAIHPWGGGLLERAKGQLDRQGWGPLIITMLTFPLLLPPRWEAPVGDRPVRQRKEKRPFALMSEVRLPDEMKRCQTVVAAIQRMPRPAGMGDGCRGDLRHCH